MRAPSLAQFLRYVCGKALSGESEQIKEYNIAVEAFGRSPNFDQKEDAIVRVEAHRLRKRLKQYYSGEGANHPVHIVIPPGQYVPLFVPNGTDNGAEEAAGLAEAPQTAAAPEVTTAPPPAPAPGRRRLRIGLIGLLSILLTGAAVLAFRVWSGQRSAGLAGSPASSERRTGSAAAAADEEIRIACGFSDEKLIDSQGNIWMGDRYFQGGSALSSPPETIQRTRDSALFYTRREGDFRYDIPLAPGLYELHLHFAERVFGPGNPGGGGETTRLFHVYVNGAQVFDSLDIVSDAQGGNTADEKVIARVGPTRDGYLHVRFARYKDAAFVNGIEVLPAPGGAIRPFRMTTGANPLRDSRGRLWSGDRYYQGGQSVWRGAAVTGARFPEAYRSERFGNFSYAIPMPPGRYKLTLHFAETWFGLARPGEGGEASRLMDVYCNGTALLRDFDIFKTAGGSGKAVERVFHDLTPNAQGKLIVSFVPVRNYAIVNAIEVEPED